MCQHEYIEIEEMTLELEEFDEVTKLMRCWKCGDLKVEGY